LPAGHHEIVAAHLNQDIVIPEEPHHGHLTGVRDIGMAYQPFSFFCAIFLNV
jgi:hypothetical protein